MAVSVNGDYFDWGCLTIDVDGVRYDNEFDSIKYSEKSAFKTIPGRGRRPKGRTRGKNEYEGEIKISREMFPDLLTQLGGSNWRNKIVNITVSYGFDDDSSNAQADKLVSLKFHSPDSDNSNNEDPLMMTLSLSMLDIVWHGESENERL